jgi:oxygen-independent coproporphyrinogen-3 oxidase
MKAALAGRPAGTAVTVAPCDRIAEFMLNALRLEGGFPREWMHVRGGIDAAAVEPLIAAAVARGWLADDGVRCVPTALGYRFLNDLQLLFVPDADDVALHDTAVGAGRA